MNAVLMDRMSPYLDLPQKRKMPPKEMLLKARMARRLPKVVMPRKKKEPLRKKSLLAMLLKVKSPRAPLSLFLSRSLLLPPETILKETPLPPLMEKKLPPRKVRPRRKLLLLHLPPLLKPNL